MANGSYNQLRIENLGVGSAIIGSACSDTAAIDAATFGSIECSSILSSGALTIGAYQGTIITASAASTVNLETTSLTLNGVSALPEAISVPSATITYSIPTGFSNNGIVIGTPTVALSLYLPTVASVPAGYSVNIYNLGTVNITLSSAIADPTLVFYLVGETTPATVTILPGTSYKCAWIGKSYWFLW